MRHDWRRYLGRILGLSSSPDPLTAFFGVLKGLGFAPARVYDVGAHRGTWTRQAITFFPGAHYTLIEPQDHLRRDIEDLVSRGHQITWINAALAVTPGTRPFTITDRDDSSTLRLTPEEARAAGWPQVSVEVRTLNDLLRASGAAVPDMVKIDAEGLDLAVLAGATDLIGHTEVFFIEAAVGATVLENRFARVVGYMATIGYDFVDVTDLNRRPRDGALWLRELAFLRRSSPLWSRLTTYN